MSETIKMTGKLLIFDKPDMGNWLFPKDCKITYPEKVPVICNFMFDEPDAILGFAIVHEDEKYLLCDVELTNVDRDILREDFHDEIYIGGFYDEVKHHIENGIMVIDEANLVYIGTTFRPADEEMKIRVVESE